MPFKWLSNLTTGETKTVSESGPFLMTSDGDTLTRTGSFITSSRTGETLSKFGSNSWTDTRGNLYTLGNSPFSDKE